MVVSHRQKFLIGCLLAGLLVLVLTTLYALTRSQRDIGRREAAAPDNAQAGFSFFDINSETVLNRDLREALADQLGRDAISRRGLIDLVVIDPNFTQTHLPDIYRYREALNPTFEGRREHAVTTLTYRRAHLKGVPFRMIRFVFDQLTGKPLYLVVEAFEDDPELFPTLQSRWGTPDRFKGSREGDHALVWRKPDEILCGVSIRRRGGRIERQLRYYFLGNIGHLVEQERAAAEARRRQTDKIKQRAF